MCEIDHKENVLTFVKGLIVNICEMHGQLSAVDISYYGIKLFVNLLYSACDRENANKIIVKACKDANQEVKDERA